MEQLKAFIEKYQAHKTIIHNLFKMLSFFLTVGVIILALLPYQTTLKSCYGECLSKGEMSALIWKIFMAIDGVLIALVTVLYAISNLISMLFSWLTKLLSFFPTFKSGEEMSFAEFIFVLLAASHFAWVFLTGFIYTY